MLLSGLPIRQCQSLQSEGAESDVLGSRLIDLALFLAPGRSARVGDTSCAECTAREGCRTSRRSKGMPKDPKFPSLLFLLGQTQVEHKELLSQWSQAASEPGGHGSSSTRE